MPDAPREEKDVPREVTTILCEKSLYWFSRCAWEIVEPAIPFVDNWHIRDGIADHLQAVTEGLFDKLLINVPPGSMKSLLCSVFWPCWVWTTQPETRWMLASYSKGRVAEDSGRRRNVIQSEWYQGQWPTDFAQDKNQVLRFQNLDRGWMFATQVGGGLGEHPDYIVLDDPNDTEETDSKTKMTKAWEWQTGTLASRGIARNVKRAVIQQRTDELDFSGHILGEVNEEDRDDDYVHICLPAEYEENRMVDTPTGWNDPRTEPGDLLWPELFGPEKIAELKKMGVYRAAGQLQQSPAPKEGGMFKREYFRIVDEPPDPEQRRHVVRYWDLAASQDQGDYTAGVLISWGFCKSLNRWVYFVEDIERGQWLPGTRNDTILSTAKMDGADVFVWGPQDPGAGGKEAAITFAMLLDGFIVATEPPINKVRHADPLAAAFEAGNVVVVKGEWNEPFIRELVVFPRGSNDDQVDGASGAYAKCSAMSRSLLGQASLKTYRTNGKVIVYNDDGQRGSFDVRKAKIVGAVCLDSITAARAKHTRIPPSAIQIWAKHKSRFFLLDAWRGIKQWNELLEVLTTMMTEHDCRSLSVQMSDAATQMTKVWRTVSVTQAEVNEKKLIEESTGIQKLFADGQIFVPVSAHWKAGVVSEWLNWTGTVDDPNQHVKCTIIAGRVKGTTSGGWGIVKAPNSRSPLTSYHQESRD